MCGAGLNPMGRNNNPPRRPPAPCARRVLRRVGGHPSTRPVPAGRLCGVAADGLPELDVNRVRRWCEKRVPVQLRDQLTVECDLAPRHLTILECRPPWREGFGPEWTRFPIARLRYTKITGTWSLYWRDRNLRFHEYYRISPSRHVDDLLAEIDRDPTAIFGAEPTGKQTKGPPSTSSPTARHQALRRYLAAHEVSREVPAINMHADADC
jgi:hypothetical protein